MTANDEYDMEVVNPTFKILFQYFHTGTKKNHEVPIKIASLQTKNQTQDLQMQSKSANHLTTSWGEVLLTM
jgi:hypothetical protein